MRIGEQDWLIVKLGGSILTKADGSVNQPIIESVGRDLAIYTGPKILVHGTGHIGRSVLRHHRLTSDFLPAGSSDIVMDFRQAVNSLSAIVTKTFKSIGITSIISNSHKIMNACSGHLIDNISEETLDEWKNSKAIIVLHGDALEDVECGYYFCSGDEIISLLAARLAPAYTIFLTDVDGVYNPFPPNETDVPIATLDHSILEKINEEYIVGQGEMTGKVKQALYAAKYAKFCYIANGTCNGLLARLTSGKIYSDDKFSLVVNIVSKREDSA